MKRLIIAMVVLSVALSATYIKKNYRTVHMKTATLVKSGEEKMYCSICGMTLPMFYKTNHAADHKNGKHDQYCSVTCMVEDAVINNSQLTNFKVVDNVTLKLIPSKDAIFVVGSKKPGTMSMISKYAFNSKNAALKFKEANGGKLMHFDALLKLVKKSQAKDILANKKRQAKAIKKGSTMYKKMCKVTYKEFISIAQAKVFLKKSRLCGDIHGKKLQALALYLVFK